MKISKHAIGTRSSGNIIEIISYTLGKGNPKIYIQSGIHGGEATNVWVIKKLIESLKEYKGTITFVPLANPVSWETQMYFYTCGKFSFYDGRDWNRNFPGDEKGSLGSRIAHALFTIAREHDLVIDLHTSRKSKPFGIVSSEKYLDLLKQCGTEYGFLSPSIPGTLNYACEKENIPCVTLEIGSHDTFDEEVVKQGVKIIQNVLIFKRVLTGNFTTTKHYFTALRKYHAPCGGLVTYSKQCNQEYFRGDVLYKIVPSSDITQEIEIKAEEDGVVLKIAPTHIFNEGDEVMQVIPKESIKEFNSGEK